MKFNKGDIFYKDIGFERYKCHIVDIVDGNMVVYKWYVKRLYCWNYDIESDFIINYSFKIGLYSL